MLKTLPSGSVDAVITDPPYGIGWNTDYTRFTNGLAGRTALAPVANDSSEFDPAPWLQYPLVVLFGANCFSNRLPCGSWFVWDKRFRNGKAFLADGEVAWMSRGHGVYIKSVTQQGFVRPEKREHPTQKPVEIMRWIVEKATKPGMTILDPYMGSGTTGVACVQTGRNFIGIEISEEYFKIAERRIAEAQQQLALPLEAK